MVTESGTDRHPEQQQRKPLSNVNRDLAAAPDGAQAAILRLSCHLPRRVVNTLIELSEDEVNRLCETSRRRSSDATVEWGNNSRTNIGRSVASGAGVGVGSSAGQSSDYRCTSSFASSSYLDGDSNDEDIYMTSDDFTNSSYASSFGTGSGSSFQSSMDLSHWSKDDKRWEDVRSKALYPMPLPQTTKYQTVALLFVDISGFTRLSTILDSDIMSREINNYFDLLLGEVERYGGDLLKFAGDAFYVEWPVQEDDGDETENEEAYNTPGLGNAALRAASCGASILRNCSRYKVRGLSEEVALLDVHCGVGSGRLATLHVGDEDTREVLFIGDPINQVAACDKISSIGELVASPEAIKAMAVVCDDIPDTVVASETPIVIADRDATFFSFEDLEAGGSDPCDIDLPEILVSDRSPDTATCILWQMSLYVHPVARIAQQELELDSYKQKSVDAELRSVYSMFIRPKISSRSSGKITEDCTLFGLLNDILQVTMDVVGRFKGHLLQYINDDKGIVLIVTFGQVGATFPNLVAERGLPATIAIYESLLLELGVESNIGATYGTAYCGFIGGRKRHAFSVLGKSMNLAARLMCSDINPGILVDEFVRQASSDRYNFLSLDCVKAKGYADPVPVYEPQSVIEREWRKLSVFVGRDKEISSILRVAKRLLSKKRRPHMFAIQGDSGYGKSSFVLEALERLQKLSLYHKKKTLIWKAVAKDGEELIPFSMFKHILLAYIDEQINVSAIRRDDIDDDDFSIGAFSIESDENFGVDSDDRRISQLRKICSVLKHSEAVADSVGQYLLGLELPFRAEGAASAPVAPLEVVDFFADMFASQTSLDADLFTLVLDDVQWMDALSWKVIQRLFERGTRCLIVASSRPFSSNDMKFDPAFWDSIQADPSQDAAPHPRLTEIELKPFNGKDVRSLVAKEMGHKTHEICDEVSALVHKQSLGIPYFCKVLIEEYIQAEMFESRQNDSIGWRDMNATESREIASFERISDLLLHRFDHFAETSRQILKVAALLGFNFSLTEIQKVACHEEAGISVEDVQLCLSHAVKASILIESMQGGATATVSDSAGVEGSSSSRKYTFTHALWRSALLDTMLVEKKRGLHKKIADVLMDGVDIERITDASLAIRAFHHLRECGSLSKGTELALSISRYFDSLQLLNESINRSLAAIAMWTEWSSEEGDDNIEEGVAGDIPLALLNKISPADLESLAKLHISIAKNYSNIREVESSDLFYRRCDEILRCSTAAAQMKDRTVFFLLYSGSFSLLYIGAIPDPGVFRQLQIAERFVEQARLHGDLVHTCRALSMQSLTLSRQGRFQEAIDVQKEVAALYSPEQHSAGIIKEYSSDHAAQLQAYSVLWYKVQGRLEEAMAQIDYILADLMPLMPEKNLHNSMMCVYPAIVILQGSGQARQAEEVFRKYVYDIFHEHFGGKATTYFLFIYKPLLIYLQLSGDEQEGAVRDEADLREIEDWILDDDKVGTYSVIQTLPMCPMGKDVHCVVAEICLLLLDNYEEDVTEEQRQRQKQLFDKGLDQAKMSLACTKDDPGFEYVRKYQSEKIVEKFSACPLAQCKQANEFSDRIMDF